MHASITAANMFDAAILLERNGGIFYRRAAQFASSALLRQRLLELADAERVHMQTFLKLKDLLADAPESGPARDTSPEALRYLETFARSGVFNLDSDAAHALADDAEMRDVLEFAAERERDSIMFYLGIKEVLASRAERDKIGAILYEEMSHVVLLDQELKKLMGEEPPPARRWSRAAFSTSE